MKSCYGYRLRKWTRRSEFKFWRRLFSFHLVILHREMLESIYSPPPAMSRLVGQTESFRKRERLLIQNLRSEVRRICDILRHHYSVMSLSKKYGWSNAFNTINKSAVKAVTQFTFFTELFVTYTSWATNSYYCYYLETHIRTEIIFRKQF